MERLFDLQLFADDADNVTADTATDAPGSVNDKADVQREVDKKATVATLKEQPAKYTDADVDEILNKKFAKWQQQQQKAVDEAKKLAEMNATEKAEYERDQLKKELDALKKAAALSEMTKAARKMLSENGITISDELLSVIVTEDAEETKAAVDGFTQAFTEAVESAVKDRLKGEPPRKGAGGAATMTKEQIMSIKDPELRQKKMLENKELFNF